ncbi:RING-box protein 2 isoform X3 [Rhineura floridana]|uniref:RING-box protein 2 isoform X3 n=1 Tax=Rhineura floridana TaxID=261503 RepID=UPI002AC7EA74|nr:RING-box protein 2 isoform X3 [Rhineura floridana]
MKRGREQRPHSCGLLSPFPNLNPGLGRGGPGQTSSLLLALRVSLGQFRESKWLVSQCNPACLYRITQRDILCALQMPALDVKLKTNKKIVSWSGESVIIPSTIAACHSG